MKYSKSILRQLQQVSYFDKKAIYQLSEQYAVKKGTVDSYVKQFLTNRELIQLKKGLYITTKNLEKHQTDVSYTFYLANILRQPSYVSMWSALQYYDLATEAIYTITSVTPKVTRSYINKVGNFKYHSIKQELFAGFELIKSNFDFFIASPAKAILDIIYFKTNQFQSMRVEELQALLEDLRIDIEEINIKERKIFYTMIKKYCK